MWHTPSGFFEMLIFLAGIGAIALIGLGGYSLFWLITHIAFV